jgi:adenylate cyclase
MRRVLGKLWPAGRISALQIGIVAGLLMVAVHFSGVLNRLELAGIDLEYRATPRLNASDVAVVGLDAHSLTALNRRPPLPRRYHAQVLLELRHKYRPRAIIYDFQFTEKTNPRDDIALLQAVSEARPVVLVTAEVLANGGTRVLGNESTQRATGAVVANAQFVPDSDGVFRRLHLVLQGLPTVAVVGAAVAQHRPVRTDRPQGKLWINFAGPPRTIPTYSFVDVMHGAVPPRDLEGKIVVVGPTAITFQDVKTTGAGGGPMTGAELIANAVNTLVHDRPIRSASTPLAILFILFAGLVAAVPYAHVVPHRGGWRLALTLRLVLLAAAAATVLLALREAFAHDLILPAADSAGAFLLGSILAGVLSVTTAIHERRLAEVRARFGRYMPEQVVEQVLVASDGTGRLEGRELTATVMFADIRGFTASVERRPASQVIGILDRYLARMSETVMAHGGTVVSYLGDGIMAVFGAPLAQPDHADRAVRAALAMLDEALGSVNSWLVEQGSDVPALRIGIGLHSGAVASGTVGSDRRLEYAVVGDTTNTASRIESMTKDLGVALLVSESTERLLVSDALRDELVDVGVHTLRGRAAAVRLWTARAAAESAPAVADAAAGGGA